MLSGRLEFLNGDELQTAEAGDFVFIPRGTRHRFTNMGDSDARMLFLYTPGGLEKFFVENGDEPQPGRQSPEWGPERYATLVDPCSHTTSPFCLRHSPARGASRAPAGARGTATGRGSIKGVPR